MKTLDWYLPLEKCKSVDEVCRLWGSLLDEYDLYADNDNPHFRDAMLSFIGRSALPANVKMGSVLASVQTWDMDLRLALGALSIELDPFMIAWHDDEPHARSTSSKKLSLPSNNPSMEAFVNGRLAGLRDTFLHDGVSVDQWRESFWRQFLVMSCSWDDISGVKLALEHGADVTDGDDEPIRTAAKVPRGEDYWNVANYQKFYPRIIDVLLEASPDSAASAAAALSAAAESDNVDMLTYLSSNGASLHATGDAALRAAAGSYAPSAVDWLIEHGANVRADNDAPLIAAVAALDGSTVERLLNAGCDVHSDDELSLRTAITTQPVDLFHVENDLISLRVEMIALLILHGAQLIHPKIKPTLASAPRRTELIASLLNSGEIDDGAKSIIRRLGGQDAVAGNLSEDH